jgi:hypothetical protein
MKKLVGFLGYVAVVLVGLLGAYIVIHMWQLSERWRSPFSLKERQSERVVADETPPVTRSESAEAKNTKSPNAD